MASLTLTAKTYHSFAFDVKVTGLTKGVACRIFIRYSDDASSCVYDRTFEPDEVTQTTISFTLDNSDDYIQDYIIPNKKYAGNIFIDYSSSPVHSTAKTCTTNTPILSIPTKNNRSFTAKITNTSGTDEVVYFTTNTDKKVLVTNASNATFDTGTTSTTSVIGAAADRAIHWSTNYSCYAIIYDGYGGTYTTNSATVKTSSFSNTSIKISSSGTTCTTAKVTVSGIPEGFYITLYANGEIVSDYVISSGTSDKFEIEATGLNPGTSINVEARVTSDYRVGYASKTTTITTIEPYFDIEEGYTSIVITAKGLIGFESGTSVFFYVYEGWDATEDKSHNYGGHVDMATDDSDVELEIKNLPAGTDFTINISVSDWMGDKEKATTLKPSFSPINIGEISVGVEVTGINKGDTVRVYIRREPSVDDEESSQITCHDVQYKDDGANTYVYSTTNNVGIARINNIIGKSRRIQPGMTHYMNISINGGSWLNGGGDNGDSSQEFKTDALSSTYTRTPKRDSVIFNVENIPSPSYVWFYINRVTVDDNDDESFTVVEEIITSSTPDNNIEVWDGSLNKTFTSTEHPNLKQGYYYVCNVHIKYDGVTHDVGRSKRFGLYERPENWEWESTVQKDALIRIRAEEWNNFTKRINAFRTYSGLKEGDFTDAIGGITKIGATICNQAYDAIYFIDGRGALPDKAVAKKPISASFFNKLMTALNAIP